MKEHPILFSTPMVQAILEGRKTQTRRVVKPQPRLHNGNGWPWKMTPKEGPVPYDCPYGQPGYRLYVRETWMKNPNIEHFPDQPIYYKASKSAQFIEEWPGWWKPSIHMPKTAARIWLEIEEVKVERVQDISEEDIFSEGIQIPVSENNKVCYRLGVTHSALSFLPAGCFADNMPAPTQKQVVTAFFTELWVKINGIESWHENPWVWVIKFKVLSTTGKPKSSNQ